MAIRVSKNRLHIGEDVREVYVAGAMKALKHIFETMNTSPSRAAARYMKEHRGDIARLNAVAKKVKEPGQGLDLAVTRMRNMRYHRLEVFETKGKQFLAGQTRDLKIEIYDETWNMESREYELGIVGYVDLGDYNIFVPVDALATVQTDTIHFVPVDHRAVRERHYHHTASRPGDRAINHPTEMSPSTCWSEFAEPVMETLLFCDIPELFKLLRIFVGRYYTGSPLSEPQWGRRIPV